MTNSVILNRTAFQGEESEDKDPSRLFRMTINVIQRTAAFYVRRIYHKSTKKGKTKMFIFFKIPGKVQAKQSAKFRHVNTNSGKDFIQSYQPSKVINYANWVKQCFVNAYPEHNPMIFEGKELAITITAYFEIPKSKSKKFKEEAMQGKRRPITKPDTDNIAKNIKDALNKIAFPDDSQIVTEMIEKRYGTPGAEVYITEIKE